MSAITAHPEELHAPHSSKNMPAPILHAQNSLTNLHKKVRQSIRQRQRLADAGEAVAKINHDLRNMLASVMLVTDQLESSADPKVAQVAPVVIRATEQATNLCQNMLDYLSDLPVARPELIEMDALMEELASTANIYLEYSGPDRLYTDRLMLYRILLNLFRNAADAGADNLLIDVWQAGHLAVIDIIDNGPGIEPRMQN